MMPLIRSDRSWSNHRTSLLLLVLAGSAILLSQGCASVPKRHPLPTEYLEEAEIPGIERARAWGDTEPKWADQWFALNDEELQEMYPAGYGKSHHYLAISGGGAKGAFGAGLLKGWTELGTRPEFQIVTGISTGALTAPFAFLGPEYDDTLEEMFTHYSTKDMVDKRNLFNTLTSDAAASTKKLEALIGKYVDEDVLAALTAEAARGRQLFIGTTNLDAERPVVWRVSTIAASGEPKALDLIRKIILASASIPVAFPPVAFEVEANGQLYDELHVDGGTSSQVFLYPALMDWARVVKELKVPEPPHVYVIRNSRLDPHAAVVDRKLLPIAGKTIASLIRTQGVGDLYRIYALAQRDGLDFNLAFMPATFTDIPDEVFDPVWMRKLFDLGYEMGKSGYHWRKGPPQFEPAE